MAAANASLGDLRSWTHHVLQHVNILEIKHDKQLYKWTHTHTLFNFTPEKANLSRIACASAINSGKAGNVAVKCSDQTQHTRKYRPPGNQKQERRTKSRIPVSPNPCTRCKCSPSFSDHFTSHYETPTHFPQEPGCSTDTFYKQAQNEASLHL